MKQLINFIPLEATESLKRRNKAASQRPISAKEMRKSMLLGLPLFFGAMILMFIVFSLIVVILGPYAIVTFPLGVLVLVRFVRKREKRMRNALGEFIQANQWLEGGKLPQLRLLDPNMIPDSEWAIMHGTLDGVPFWLYKVNQADFQNGSTGAQNLVLSLQLPNPVPTMLLSSRFQLLGLNLKGYIANQLKLAPIQLEGDFDQYFQLYARPDQQIEALTYMTPDVMEVLRNDCWMLGVDYFNDTISLWRSDIELSYTLLRQLFTASQLLIQEHKEKHA